MESLRAKRRKIAGNRRAPSAFTPGSSQRAPSRPIAPTAQTTSQPGPSRHSRADSVESDAEDDYQHTGIDLPDQLPCLPQGYEEDDSIEATDAEGISPKPLSRSERLREILKFRGLAERYGETDIHEGTQHTTRSDLRLAQAVHAYAIEYYISRGMLAKDKAKGGKKASLRTRSGNTRGGQGAIDRGQEVIPPHLIHNSAKKVYVTTLGLADATVPYEVFSDAADSDYVASDNEEVNDEEADMQVESTEPKRKIGGSRKTEASVRKELENVQHAFDETALVAIAAYIEEIVRSLLGDHGNSVV